MDPSTTSGAPPTGRWRESEHRVPRAVPRPAACRRSPRGAPVRAPASGTRVGCDLVELERFARVLARNPQEFRDELFTAAEQEAARTTEELARRFAVKEAALKALGIGLV